MSKSRLEWRVGLFVLIGLVLLAILLLQFSKGLTFRSTYDIKLRTESVTGLKLGASVQMAGVQVGSVSDIQLDADGRHVTMTLRIYGKYEVHKDAVFALETSGFLGDQYVAIMPTGNKDVPLFRNGDVAVAEEPFNLQAAARAALGFINRLDETAKKLNDTVSDIRGLLLTQETLTNLAVSAANLRAASDKAVITIDHLNALIETNAPAIAQSGTNLVVFSEQLTRFGASLQAVLATNSSGIEGSVKNIESSTAMLKNLMTDAQSGKGLIGLLLKDEQVGKNLTQIVQNVSTTTSNLNSRGLWGILWRSKASKTNAPPEVPLLESPKARAESK
jgi:phospholipid/cholesterol/gamma-HCH transport system substrate-binding protein